MNFLNIAIPTYKRPEKLRELLSSIVDEFSEDVSISIFDDSEEGYLDNLSIVHLFKDLIPINYEKNTSNLGIDKNIAKCFDRSNSRYTIVIGEDDLFLPFGLSRILGTLREKSPKFLFLRYTYFNGVKDINWSSSVPEDCDTMDFLGKYIDKLGFIGSFAIETNHFNMQLFLEEKTYFNHVGCLLVGLDKINRIYSTSDNVIRNRVGNLNAFTWRNEALNVFTGFDKVLALVERGNVHVINVPQLRKLSKKRFDPFILRRLIKLKAQYVLSNREIYYLGSGRNVGPHRFLAMLIPRSICALIYSLHEKKIWF